MAKAFGEVDNNNCVSEKFDGYKELKQSIDAVGYEELADVLWPEETVDNPAGAIKNLMYRLRTTLNNELGMEIFAFINLPIKIQHIVNSCV